MSIRHVIDKLRSMNVMYDRNGIQIDLSAEVEALEQEIRLDQDAHVEMYSSGRRIYLYKCTPDDIFIEDIAFGLSRIPRYLGQTAGSEPYSVAEHSVLGAVRMQFDFPEFDPREFLLHDGDEAYIGDLVRPVKKAGSNYAHGMASMHITEQIRRRFGLSMDDSAPVNLKVKEYDLRIYEDENDKLRPWLKRKRKAEPLGMDFKLWNYSKAWNSFMQFYKFGYVFE